MGNTQMDQSGFRGPQVCKIVGITYRQLDYWARSGLLTPSVSEAKGTGIPRLYSYLDVLRIKVIKRLLDSGVSLQRARKAIQCLEDNLGEDISSANLVMANSNTVLAKSQEAVFDLLRGGQGVFNVLALSGVVEELDAAIHSFGSPPPDSPSHVAI
ncbi:MAG TPA: MerR family transcriptional regulator [Acidimicrobiales bacterium]|nr:MerR family transcriptional regulator [Acidimicrobiales bacterium]